MPEKYDIYGNPIGLFADENIYYDTSLTDPAVVTAPLPAKFNGSRAAARRYAEGYRWGQENVVQPRERIAPYVGAGLAATMAAPVAIDLAASGLASAAADPLWKAAAKRMAIDLPAFEAIDRLPQVWGDDRLTQQGTNLIKQTTPIGRYAPWVVDVAGPFIAGMVPGMLGDMAVRGTVAGVNDLLSGIGRRIANNRMGYLAPMADVVNTETVSKFDIPATEGQMRYYVQDPVTKETTLIDANRAKTLVEQGVPEEYIIQEELKSTLSSKPIVEKASQAGYQIERYPGYQLKSLMAGNPLEKQLSKTGTVSVNSIRALSGKASKVEKAVIEKVLNGEAFKGQKAVDYNKFRKAVQDELINYERTPDTRWENYGMENLHVNDNLGGWAPNRIAAERFIEAHPELNYMSDEYGKIYESIIRDEPGLGRIYEYGKPVDNDVLEKIEPNWFEKFSPRAPELNTYTFSSSRIPNGSAKHYDSNTLGHSRTYTTADEPDVLHVMESQSDWSQEGEVAKNAAYVKDRMAKHPGTESDPDSWLSYAKGKIKTREEEVESLKKMLETGVSDNGEKLEPHAIKQIKDELLPASERRLARAKSRFYGPDPQEIYLADNYTTRQIQENLRYAAEKGQKKMRYPTRETAAKIEGYPEREAYFDAQGNDITTSGQKVFTYGKAIDAEIEALQKERALITQQENWGLSQENNARIAEINKRLSDIVANTEAKPLPGITKKTVYDYEDILRKYTEFPKQFKKLYKGADVRTVTDPKGNTWYEVDVPENYLQQEWAYKNGGLLDRLNKHYNGDRSKIVQAMQYARGGFKRDAATDAGDQYYDIVRQRRNSVFNALMRAGMDPNDAAHLAPMIVTQQTMEGGWVLNRKDNNYGGMKFAGKTIVFDSEDDFQDAYIKMLDSKWHNGRAVENSWRSARNLDDWARILNREDLGLSTKEAWEKYNRGKQGNDFVYLYAPQWENNNKPYREHLKKTEDRTAAYLKMVEADEPYSSLVQKQEAPQMSPVSQQPSRPLGLFRSLIPTSVQQKMPATQSVPAQQQAPLLRSLIPTSVQKKMNGRAAGGLIERYGIDKVRAAMQEVKR